MVFVPTFGTFRNQSPRLLRALVLASTLRRSGVLTTRADSAGPQDRLCPLLERLRRGLELHSARRRSPAGPGWRPGAIPAFAPASPSGVGSPRRLRCLAYRLLAGCLLGPSTASPPRRPLSEFFFCFRVFTEYACSAPRHAAPARRSGRVRPSAGRRPFALRRVTLSRTRGPVTRLPVRPHPARWFTVRCASGSCASGRCLPGSCASGACIRSAP
jgi:hypothetical protein